MVNYKEMQDFLMKELRLYHFPVAVTFFFDDEAVQAFAASVAHVRPVKPITFCQAEVAARMKGLTVLCYEADMGCSNSKVSFGWRAIDEKEIATQLKYCTDLAQAERFLRSKPRLPEGTLKAIAVGPLADSPVEPSTVHFYCDNMQSYHLAVDYMAATETHPLRPMITMSSSACGGAVFSYNEQGFNCCPACSGSYNSGKTERGEVNVFIPGSKLEATVARLAARIAQCGTSSITKPGDPFPGADICKNCPLILFKKASPEACAGCESAS